jgi:toxin ParE1/3/4
MDIHLSEQQALLIRGTIEAGRFRSADDAVSEALRLLEQREARIAEGVRHGEADAEQGNFVECQGSPGNPRQDTAILMQVRWTAQASADVYRIARRIRQDNPAAAQQVVDTIYDSVMALADFPRRAPLGRSKSNRELVCLPYPYTVVYRITGQDIDVLHLYHHAQDWP